MDGASDRSLFVPPLFNSVARSTRWPPRFFVSPSQVKFGGSYAKNQVFPFKVENKSTRTFIRGVLFRSR